MTNKSYIIRYILLKIILSEYLPNKIIPSENKIAEKFKCTRMHVREVYLKLSENNIIYSKQGSGYFVSENAIDSIYFPHSFLKKTIIKPFLNCFKIYNENSEEIGFIKTNINLNINLESFNQYDLLKLIVNQINFNINEIKNFFENNVIYDNFEYNKFTTIFVKEDNQKIIIETFLKSNINIFINKSLVI
ncbi:MAG: winged helix-turn-helix domain-containing protein [Candidatus Ureaplasma intestinipullorum]|uniref:Winged helix-turn-helix domain-containing protein n=1 Tax=Candidatus Ureaplasma intestinipullorum TaxID=2838770 RepID=A0A9E2NVS3_9BACT|nr:winged helix-turn-helix domain-containing protein [Candidatus Ureaplasma intestinipullorum]